MKTILIGLVLGFGTAVATAQDRPQLHAEVTAIGETVLNTVAPTGQLVRLEFSQDLDQWFGLTTFLSTASNQQTDSGAPFQNHRFYRALVNIPTNSLTGDHLSTDEGEVTLHPINHATFVMGWQGKTIYFDPVGGGSRFQGLPRPDLVLITHSHPDHYDQPTLNAIQATNAMIIAPREVYQLLSPTLRSVTTVLTNGASAEALGIHIDAIPAYNLTSVPIYHVKGTGNGYVLTVGGKRIYVSGDTEDIQDVRNLRAIDVAFVCMNLPYTMSVTKAVSAVRAFQPSAVYIYHYSGYTSTDLNKFKQLVGTDLPIEVRLRKWY